MIVFGVITLKKIKDDEERAPIRRPSLEATRTRVQKALDLDSLRVVRTPKKTTLEKILREQPGQEFLAAPDEFSSKRVSPFETQVWEMDVFVRSCMIRTDHDLYLLVQSGASGSLESPDPATCGQSPFIDGIRAVWDKLEKEYHPSLSPVKIERMARVRGIGYFGTKSPRDTGARLMPLLDLKWIDGASTAGLERRTGH